MIAKQQVAANLVGTVLERAYRLTRLIGEGGMGAVYEAVQLRLNKRVAIKLMTRELAANQEALSRFHREAQITSHLGHHHLVTVIDFGTAESGEPYLVMEYLKGEDLEQRIRRVGRLPAQAAIHITRQTASALGAAHTQGIVHRDLKPANVFLAHVDDEPDFVKVLDFGISKMKAERTRLTRAFTVIGTPNYMAPEQAVGLVDAIDHRADQWALACIAWEMLCGRPPFVAEDIAALFYQILHMNPQPLASLAPDLRPGVEEVILQALAKDPNQRFESIKLFARTLERAVLGRPAELTPLVDLPPGASPTKTLCYGESSSMSCHVPVSPCETPDRCAPVKSPASWLTYDTTVPVGQAPPRRTLKLYAIGAVAGFALTLVGLVLVRAFTSFTPASSGAATAAPLARTVSRAAPIVTPTPPVESSPPASAPPPRSVRGKRSGASRKASRPPKGFYSNPFEADSDPFEREGSSRRSADPFVASPPKRARSRARRPNPF